MLDKTIIKAGLLNRKAKTIYKVDERFVVLVPGKLLLFKGSDISSKRVRYVTTLARARVEATHGQPSFQILVPNTKALSLVASSAEAAKEWILALEDAIEYANRRQGAGNQFMQTDAAAAQMAQVQQGQSDDMYMNPHINRLQNMELVDMMGTSANSLRPAGQSTERFHTQPVVGTPQQMYMDKGPSSEEWRGPEAWNGVLGLETTDASGFRKQNPRIGTNFEPNYAPEYHATPSGGGSYNHQDAKFENADGSFGAGPSNVFGASYNTSLGFVPSERSGSNMTTQGTARPDPFSQGGPMGGRYTDNTHEDAPYGYMEPQGNTQRAPFANTLQGNFQANMQRAPVERNPYVDQQSNAFKGPLGNNSYGNQLNNPHVDQKNNALMIPKANNPYVGQQDNPYLGQQKNALEGPMGNKSHLNNPYVDQKISASRIFKATDPYVGQQDNPYLGHQNNVRRAPNANNPYVGQQNSPYMNEKNFVLRASNANNPPMDQQSNRYLDQRSNALEAPIANERYVDRQNNGLRAPMANDRYVNQQTDGLRAPMDLQHYAMKAPVASNVNVDYPGPPTSRQDHVDKARFELPRAPLTAQSPRAQPGNLFGLYGNTQEQTPNGFNLNRPNENQRCFGPLSNSPEVHNSEAPDMHGRGFDNTSYGTYASHAGHQPPPHQ